MLIHEDILHHLQDDISKVVHVIFPLLMYLRYKILRSSLLMSLQSKFLRSSLLIIIYLQNRFLQSSIRTSLPSLIVSLRNRVLQSSLLVSLQSNFVLASSLTLLQEIFLRHVYVYISTIAPISKT